MDIVIEQSHKVLQKRVVELSNVLLEMVPNATLHIVMAHARLALLLFHVGNLRRCGGRSGLKG